MIKKRFRLPLLAALPAALPLLLASCSSADDLSKYKRTSYTSYAECMRANAQYVNNGMPYPCQKSSSGGGVFGPYMAYRAGQMRYVGYGASGAVAPSGLSYNMKSGTYSAFSAPVSRGGFTTSARATSGTASMGS